MKAVHLSYADGGGGAAKAAYRIHRGLLGLGVDSRMVVSRKTCADKSVSDPGSPMGRVWSQASAYLDLLPAHLMPGGLDGYCSLSWVGTGPVAKAISMQPDLVHLHWINSGFMRLEEIRQLKCPVVWRLADMWPMAGAEHYVGSSRRYIEGYKQGNRPSGTGWVDLSEWTWKRKRQLYPALSDLTIVTPSRWLAECARNSLLFRGRRVEVIPTGQNISIYRPIPKDVARQILGLPASQKIIMTASMQLNDERKGVDLLLRALKCLEGREYALLLLGGGSVPSGLPFTVHFLGKLEDDIALAIAYSAADVFVASSREENLPNTVIEAMACGTPAVAFEIGGMPDLIRTMQTGYLAQPFDVEDMAHGMDTILEHEDIQASMAAAGRILVEQEFSVDVQACRYNELYKDILRLNSN